jgi:hypothetical protein
MRKVIVPPRWIASAAAAVRVETTHTRFDSDTRALRTRGPAPYRIDRWRAYRLHRVPQRTTAFAGNSVRTTARRVSLRCATGNCDVLPVTLWRRVYDARIAASCDVIPGELS